MAYENSIGQGLALGTLAHPDNSHPFTNAVIHNQKLDLMEASRKAKEDAAAKKLSQEMGSKIKLDTDAVLPIFQPLYTNTVAEGLSGMRSSTNDADISTHRILTQQKLEVIKAQHDAAMRVINDKDANIPQDLKEAFFSPNGTEKIQQLLKEKPQYGYIVGVKDGVPYLNNVKQYGVADYTKQNMQGENLKATEFATDAKGNKLSVKTENGTHYVRQIPDSRLREKVMGAMGNYNTFVNTTLDP